jgi:hypothetical protein
MARCSSISVVMMPADELMRCVDCGGGLCGLTLDWERTLSLTGSSSSMLLVAIEEAVVSIVPPGVMGAWLWLLFVKGWMVGWGSLVREDE